MSQFNPWDTIPLTNDPKAQIPDRLWDPPAWDERFKELQEIYGETIPDQRYVNSAQLFLDNPQKYTEAVLAANEVAPPRSALWANYFLSIYYERPIHVTKIFAGYGFPEGCSYRIYCFIDVERKKVELPPLDMSFLNEL